MVDIKNTAVLVGKGTVVLLAIPVSVFLAGYLAHRWFGWFGKKKEEVKA